ncbi:hypothetical protein D3C72_2565930 [compost metagenome]
MLEVEQLAFKVSVFFLHGDRVARVSLYRREVLVLLRHFLHLLEAALAFKAGEGRGFIQ